MVESLFGALTRANDNHLLYVHTMIPIERIGAGSAPKMLGALAPRHRRTALAEEHLPQFTALTCQHYRLADQSLLPLSTLGVGSLTACPRCQH
jgi:hypothetical protein